MFKNTPSAALIFASSRALVDRLVEALSSESNPPSHTHVTTYGAFHEAIVKRRWSIAFVEYADSGEDSPASALKDTQLDVPLLVVASARHEDQAAEYAAARGCGYLLWDVSARRVQLALRHSLSALEQRVRCERLCQQAEATLVLQPRLDALERVARGLAHDFNNVTTVISTMANFVRDELSPDDPRYADITEVIKAGERASTLARQLMVFSTRTNEVRCLVDPSGVIESCEGLLRRTLGESIGWQVALEPDLWPVFLDPVQFEQLLFKLTLCACQLMPNGGLFAIATRNRQKDRTSDLCDRLRDCVEIRIECTGTDNGVLAQTDGSSSTKTDEKLTEEGLTRVRTMVEQARGDLAISTGEENRLSLVVLLPRGSSV